MYTLNLRFGIKRLITEFRVDTSLDEKPNSIFTHTTVNRYVFALFYVRRTNSAISSAASNSYTNNADIIKIDRGFVFVCKILIV